jgi:presenilin-like A22 family membrane protease
MRVPVVLVIPLTLSYSFLDAEDPVEDGGDEPEPPTESELRELGPEGVSDIDQERLAATEEETLDALDDDIVDAIRAEMPERDALYIGLGDAVIPTVLVASAAFFLDAGPTFSVAGVSANLPALGAIAGTMAGLAVLLWLVLKGRAHAGLPLLNGGAIAGYLVGALAAGVTLVDALGLSGFL